MCLPKTIHFGNIFLLLFSQPAPNKIQVCYKQSNSSGVIYISMTKTGTLPHIVSLVSRVLNQTQPRSPSFLKTIFNRASGKFLRTKVVHVPEELAILKISDIIFLEHTCGVDPMRGGTCYKS